jgi:hypothetical protein
VLSLLGRHHLSHAPSPKKILIKKKKYIYIYVTSGFELPEKPEPENKEKSGLKAEVRSQAWKECGRDSTGLPKIETREVKKTRASIELRMWAHTVC